MNDKLVVLVTYHKFGIAESLGIALDAAEIPYFIDTDGHVLATPWSGSSISGTRVKIRELDSVRALEILREHSALAQQRKDQPTDHEDEEDICLQCGERMEDAEVCIACGWTFQDANSEA
jgi:hypothetical protein